MIMGGFLTTEADPLWRPPKNPRDRAVGTVAAPYQKRSPYVRFQALSLPELQSQTTWAQEGLRKAFE